ncbi:MAG: TetR/AcrR family transcriptional regulator [Ferrovibrionaceae bacterium]
MKPAANSPWTDEVQNREEQFELKRRAVLKAAARAFIQRGYYRTSLDDLAKSLHVTKPTLYYYIKNKEDILYACQAIGAERMHKAMSDAQQAGRNGLGKLMIFLKAYAEHVLDDFGRCLIMVDNRALKPETRALLQRDERALDTQLREMIAEGIADGSIGVDDPKMASFFIFGAFNWLTHWYQPEGPLSPEEIADKFLVYVRSGVARGGDGGQAISPSDGSEDAKPGKARAASAGDQRRARTSASTAR